MADITGQSYEGLVRFLLERLFEVHANRNLEAHFEKHFLAKCFHDEKICQHSKECSAISKAEKLDYGPWYDADFILTKKSIPFACIHVSHWSSPSDSSRKFWRTIEDHFQFKTLFGRSFLSLNILFEALPDQHSPAFVTELNDKLDLHGWKPAVGSAFVDAFDGTIIFPKRYEPIEAFREEASGIKIQNKTQRYKAQRDVWVTLCEKQKGIASQLEEASNMLLQLIEVEPDNRFGEDVVAHLQDICFAGRKSAVKLRNTHTPYRQGVQHAYILSKTCDKFASSRSHSQRLFRFFLDFGERLLTKKAVSELKGAGVAHPDAFLDVVTNIPVRIEKGRVVTLVLPTAAMGHMALNPAFAAISETLRLGEESAREQFFENMRELFDNYGNISGVPDAVNDLTDRDRVAKKISYAKSKLFEAFSLEGFTNALVKEAVIPGYIAPHQTVIASEYNWFIDAILSIGAIKRKQDIVSHLADAFRAETDEDLRNYAFKGNFDQLVNHLLQGIDASQFFRKGVKMTPDQFYPTIWKIIGRLIWPKVSRASRRELDGFVVDYRYRKAMRIISQSDIDPISFLLRKSLPTLKKVPCLRGCFADLCSFKGWARGALVTEVAGLVSEDKSFIWSQSVFGKKHIADKTSEICGRMRSQNLTFNGKKFLPAASDGLYHRLLVDGDWPVASKVNLLEAGFGSIDELSEA